MERPRRNRKSDAIRRMIRETVLTPDDFVLPLFVTEGQTEAIPSMPGCFRFDQRGLLEKAEKAWESGIPAVALFPAISDDKKDPRAREAVNPQGLLPETVRRLKDKLPELCVITDVAMDPYSSDGHDGLVENGKILNDPTLEILAQMAIVQSEAGADIVAPSDMMDGRVAAIRAALDAEGFSEVSILSYAAKYASALYGPFRDALESAPKSGDKKTYQMDPANSREALREISLDIDEGADIVMVKPALFYLDVIQQVSEISSVPVAAYNVSGEFALIKAAAANNWIDEKTCIHEALTCIKRAGADIIFSYHATELFC